jgi:hypothetical protein
MRYLLQEDGHYGINHCNFYVSLKHTLKYNWYKLAYCM